MFAEAWLKSSKNPEYLDRYPFMLTGVQIYCVAINENVYNAVYVELVVTATSLSAEKLRLKGNWRNTIAQIVMIKRKWIDNKDYFLFRFIPFFFQLSLKSIFFFVTTIEKFNKASLERDQWNKESLNACKCREWQQLVEG